jgi:uncharacterized membrane protein SpoIIM required for sporulation
MAARAETAVVMTPLQFEQMYQDIWQELDGLIAQVRSRRQSELGSLAGARLAELYRRTCEHLALARARAYPAYLVERLDQLTSDAHQMIYQQRDFGVARLTQLIGRDIPRAVRAHSLYVWIAAAVFYVPLVILGILVYYKPELILSVVDPETAAGYDDMYSSAAESIGRSRAANADWMAFGMYVWHNVTIAFACFACGLFAGAGSLFALAFNGIIIGAIAGYLTHRGLGEVFWSFVATHSSFELTAIVLSGAAGLRIGHAVLMPARHTRLHALTIAARESIVIIYGVAIMLFIAAAIEAFWSSSQWIPPLVKYLASAICWTGVIGYLTLQGRRAS